MKSEESIKALGLPWSEYACDCIVDKNDLMIVEFFGSDTGFVINAVNNHFEARAIIKRLDAKLYGLAEACNDDSCDELLEEVQAFLKEGE